MDRWACVDAPRFSLQLLLARRPAWTDAPVVVLDGDGPRGRIRQLNRRARSAGLTRRMTFSEAAAVVPQLKADTVETELLEQRTDEMASLLNDFAPRVERDDDHRGLVWLEVTGLQQLHDGWSDWIDRLKDRLRTELDVFVAVVVGFTRFGTRAVVRATGRSGLFESPASERRAARSVPLDRLDLSEQALETSRSLGIDTLGDLLALPAEGVRRRLGERAFRLVRRARGDLARPRPAFRPDDGTSSTDRLDRAESSRDRLLFLIKRRLQQLIDDLDSRRQRLTALHLTLHCGGDEPIETDIRPAEPTRDTGLLAELIRLRLDNLDVDAGITDITLRARGRRTDTEQLQLFASRPTRDIEAANRALARLRAEFGPDAVLAVDPSEGHLPESRFELNRLDRLQLPETDPGRARPAVRRFFPAPLQLPGRPDTSMCAGPHVVSGGWWIRPLRRDYHFAEKPDRLVWVFYDHRREGWYIHGEY